MEATIDKCLAFCQALVSSNQKFTFTLSIGKETFNFDNKELVASSCVHKKKKKSPSQIRREEKRREARKLKIAEKVADVSPSATLQQAAEKTAVNAVQQESTTLEFKCEQCDYKSTSERGLKQHTRMKHRIPRPGLAHALKPPPSSLSPELQHRRYVPQVVADDREAEDSTPSPQLPSPPSPPPPSKASPSLPIILKKPVKMLNGDPVSVKKK